MEVILNVFFFLITLSVGIVSIWITVIHSNKAKASQKSTRLLISEITGLFSASQKVGIVTAYENREQALIPPENLYKKSTKAFISRIEEEKKLIIIGSSLLGLKMYVDHLQEIITARIIANLETKFMLTHPCFSGFRENQESRSEGQIRKEIDNMVSVLEGYGLDLHASLRFYRGTPTCFALITSDAMLLNPYPYQVEAFKSFCLEVKRLPQKLTKINNIRNGKIPVPSQIAKKYTKEFEKLWDDPDEAVYDFRLNKGSDIYGQFYWFHFLLPWFSNQIVSYEDYLSHCKGCSCLEDGFTKKECILINNK